MFTSAKEFIQCRNSEDTLEQYRATHEATENTIWIDIIENFPAYKKWVIHNKTIPLEILELLSLDVDAEIRKDVARKRKISDALIEVLSEDKSESVRYALMCNKTLTKEQVLQIKVSDSKWLQEKLLDIIN